ncbi:interleukin-2 receptor subunit beta [Rhinatrema bivittatum]|uniref:interleukin-2 receptor subunit beta n=1 Tax=Rhinatrema bivittatum TaxID=194408 RepID=UPI001126494A|nr:interleukin-2 receptor subunit beta [Rhinatrema bivittatum]XP_029445925.1 interleukin-2 receptor subunit beta [Rhinatrema bivittatum]
MKITGQLRLLHLWLLLSLVFVVGNSQETPGLNCTFDSLATIACSWTPDYGLVDTPCKIEGTVNNDNTEETCNLSSGLTPRKCELVLRKNREDQAVTVAQSMNLVVSCMKGETTEDKVFEVSMYRPFKNILLSSPISLKIINSSDDGYNLTWHCKHSNYLVNWRKYEVRYKPTQRNQWKLTDVLFIEQEQRWVEIRNLLPDTEYEAQVRVKQIRYNDSWWSPWSQAFVWITPKADFRFSVKAEEKIFFQVLVPCISVGAIITLVVAAFYASKWFKRILHLHIPDPAKFFNPANSEHEENFQKWLASPVTPSFFTSGEVQPEISPVEIAPRKSLPKESFLPTVPRETSGQSMSSFINQGYFFFHSSNSFKIDPCQIYFTYEPFSNESSSSEGSPSYGALHSPGTQVDSPLLSAEAVIGHRAGGGSMGRKNCSFQDVPQNTSSGSSDRFLASPPLALASNSARTMQVQAGNVIESRNAMNRFHFRFPPPMVRLDLQGIEGEADGTTEPDNRGQLQHLTSHLVDCDSIRPLVPSSVQDFDSCCHPPALSLVNRDYLTLKELQGHYGYHSV